MGPVICQQLGPEALESAVTQTAGLLPRDLQALAADAAAAAAARGLDTLRMLPQLPDPSLLTSKSRNLLQHSSDTYPKPVGLLGRASDGQKGNLEAQLGATEGQKEQPEGLLVASDGRQQQQQQQQLVGPVEVCEADVQTSLDRVRQRTATIIGAPKVGRLLLLLLSLPLSCMLLSSMRSIRLSKSSLCCKGSTVATVWQQCDKA